MVKDLTLKKAELKKKLDLKIAELEKKCNEPKGKKEPIPERHMEAIKELIKIHAGNGVQSQSIQTYIRNYRKDYELPREKYNKFPQDVFDEIFEENKKIKPKPSPTPSPEKSPDAEAEAGAEAGAEV